MKILCFYLPQFHRTKENDLWWGEGYTDWIASKTAVPLYKRHNQPRIPLNNNYYDLGNEQAIAWQWQAELARNYGIYGFCIYHYWFTGKQLLEKPMEILLAHKEISIYYCICWANDTWKRTWHGHNGNEILCEQRYGNEKDWKEHFQYLLPFFKDERYIKIGNKPMINIYNVEDIDCLTDMRKCWNKLAEENGFSGIYLVGRNTLEESTLKNRDLDACYNFEPQKAMWSKRNKLYCRIFVAGKIKIIKLFSRLFKKKLFQHKYNIKRVYHLILTEKANKTKRVFLGLFPEYDDTPRRQDAGAVYEGASPKLFEKALYRLIKKSSRLGNDFIYINAWNEWGETAYLEPDEKHGYAYLEAVRLAQQKFEGEM
ncbi:glycoside hydrolase family 99-like domain-containing protein [Lachnospiraceae bacterium 38-10]